jgi:hypothetical protein
MAAALPIPAHSLGNIFKDYFVRCGVYFATPEKSKAPFPAFAVLPDFAIVAAYPSLTF